MRLFEFAEKIVETNHDLVNDIDRLNFGQEIEILLENGKTGIFTNVHLTHINTKDAIRYEQIKTITERIKANQDKLQIIGGDFNCTILSTEIQYLMKDFNKIH